MLSADCCAKEKEWRDLVGKRLRSSRPGESGPVILCNDGDLDGVAERGLDCGDSSRGVTDRPSDKDGELGFLDRGSRRMRCRPDRPRL